MSLLAASVRQIQPTPPATTPRPQPTTRPWVSATTQTAPASSSSRIDMSRPGHASPADSQTPTTCPRSSERWGLTRASMPQHACVTTSLSRARTPGRSSRPPRRSSLRTDQKSDELDPLVPDEPRRRSRWEFSSGAAAGTAVVGRRSRLLLALHELDRRLAAARVARSRGRATARERGRRPDRGDGERSRQQCEQHRSVALWARSISITSFRSSRVRECGRTRASRALLPAGAARRRRR